MRHLNSNYTYFKKFYVFLELTEKPVAVPHLKNRQQVLLKEINVKLTHRYFINFINTCDYKFNNILVKFLNLGHNNQFFSFYI